MVAGQSSGRPSHSSTSAPSQSLASSFSNDIKRDARGHADTHHTKEPQNCATHTRVAAAAASLLHLQQVLASCFARLSAR